jgi:hypothetical protein
VVVVVVMQQVQVLQLPWDKWPAHPLWSHLLERRV